MTMSLGEYDLLSGLTSDQRHLVQNLIRPTHKIAGEWIFYEGDPADKIYILKSGQVEVIKQDKDKKQQYPISTLSANQVFGELALIDDTPRSASVRAASFVELHCLSIPDIYQLPGEIRETIIANIALVLSHRLRDINEGTVKLLKIKLKSIKNRMRMSYFLINVIVSLVFYAFILGTLYQISNKLDTESKVLISLGVGFIYLLFFMMLIHQIGLSLKTCGITLENGWSAVKGSFFYSLLALLLIIFVKALLIYLVPQFNGQPLLDILHVDFATINYKKGLLPLLGYAFIGIPIQELLVRGGLQSALQKFLTGPHKIMLAIIVSNLIFSMVHLYLSVTFSLSVFPLGLFLGWLYARYKTLIAPILSHVIIAVFSFYCIGITSFLHY